MSEPLSKLITAIEDLASSIADEASSEIPGEESRRIATMVRDTLEIDIEGVDPSTFRYPGHLAGFLWSHCTRESLHAVDGWLNTMGEDEFRALRLTDVLWALQPCMASEIKLLADAHEQERRQEREA